MMKWVSLAVLVLSWVLWLVARFGGQDALSGWSFVVSYAGLATGLLLAPGMSGALLTSLRLVGVGFLLLAFGEMSWLTLYANGEPGSNVIVPNLPYYASSVLFAAAVYRIYASGESVFGFPRTWVWYSVVGAVILVALLSAGGFDPATAGLGFWTDSLDSVLNAFTAIVLICIAVLTFGGSWSRWMIPLATGFGFRLLGNIYYTLTADTYAYGSPADWCWLLGSTAIYLFLIRQDRTSQRQPSLG